MNTIRVLLLVSLTCAAAVAQQPKIESLSPSQGPITGDTIVTVKGANFTGATVTLDRKPITPLSQSDAEIRLQMPKHDNGYALISARNPGGAAYGEYLYVPPRLDEIPPGYITTVAGVGLFVRDYGPAVKATVLPAGLAFAADGTLYIAEPGNNKVTRVRTDGTIERVAGGVEVCCGAPPRDGGAAVDAPVSFPLSVALDPSGNLYIPDHNNRIRRVDVNTGIISTIAGNGVPGYSGDGGAATEARIGLPTHIAADAEDVFFVDFDTMRVRRIHLADGTISTFAGNGQAGLSGDGGPAIAAQFNMGDSDKGHLALDPAGNLYIADTTNYRIRRVDRKTSVITTFYTLPQNSPSAPDNVGEIRALAFDRDGNAYFGGNGRIVKVSPDSRFITSWGGGGVYTLPVEGSPPTGSLGHNTGIAIDNAGNIVFSDDAIGRVRRINIASGLLETVAGIGPAIIGENGPALATTFTAVNDVTFDPDGNLLIAETLRLRKLDRGGNIATIGGTGSFVGVSPPAPASQVVIAPTGITLDAVGDAEMADLSVIDHIDADGTLRQIAGRSGICGYSGDGGPATQATLCQAWDITRDRDGNLFIADTNNNRIRRVDATTGIITTVAGNGAPPNGYERYGRGTTCGDGGPAIDACLNTPFNITSDAEGNLFFSDAPEIRKIDRNGIISRFAPLPNTQKMFFDHGFLYTGQIAGVFRLDASAVLTRLAGSGTGSGTDSGFSGDGGPALSARVTAGAPAIDAEGNLFFIDGSRRIRAVRYGAVLAPPNATIQASAQGSKIRAVVFDATGGPAPGVRVDFAAPASGASCSLSSTFAITDATGVANVSCTSNCVAGSYAVTARPLTASATASVSFTNAGGPCRRSVRSVPFRPTSP